MNNVNENHVFSSIQDFAKKVADTNNLDQMYKTIQQELDNPELRYFLLKVFECYYRDKNDYYCSGKVEELAFFAEADMEANNNGKIE
jgi:hypothetical protein